MFAVVKAGLRLSGGMLTLGPGYRSIHTDKSARAQKKKTFCKNVVTNFKGFRRNGIVFSTTCCVQIYTLNQLICLFVQHLVTVCIEKHISCHHGNFLSKIYKRNQKAWVYVQGK